MDIKILTKLSVDKGDVDVICHQSTWTHCNMDIKILTKLSVDKGDVDVICHQSN